MSEVQVHPDGPIIDAKYRWIQEIDILAHIDQTDMLPENKALVRSFVHDARLGKTILKGIKKKVGKSRQIKYVHDLKKLDAYFRKSLADITEEEMGPFILDLEEGRLKQKNGKPYALETQVAIKKIIIKFYRWVHKMPEKTPDVVRWIDTCYEVKDHTFITKEQLDMLISHMVSNSPEQMIRNKAIVSVLFDVGLRADEVLNIRLRDVTCDGDYYKLRVTVSKTEKRTVVLTMSKSYLQEWLKIHPLSSDPAVQLFPMSYTSMLHFLGRAGNRIGVHLTSHTFRHSSITYWANHLQHAQLCNRFGWSMNSKQPARYIQRAGLNEHQVAEVYERQQTRQQDTEKDALYRQLALLQEQMNRLLSGDLDEVKKIMDRLNVHD